MRLRPYRPFATLLVIAGACRDPSGPSNDTPLETVDGMWYNQDTETRWTTRFKVDVREQGVLVSMWGRCHPVECAWGTELADIDRWNDESVIEVTWTSSFAITEQTYTYLGDGRFRLRAFTRFIDNSGRVDGEATGFFGREPPAAPEGSP